jgi:hypothetical protein
LLLVGVRPAWQSTQVEEPVMANLPSLQSSHVVELIDEEN